MFFEVIRIHFELWRIDLSEKSREEVVLLSKFQIYLYPISQCFNIDNLVLVLANVSIVNVNLPLSTGIN